MTSTTHKKHELKTWLGEYFRRHIESLSTAEVRELAWWATSKLASGMTLRQLEEWRENLERREGKRYTVTAICPND